jgi:hypothetical protein
VRPERLLLSEIGEELDTVLPDLVGIITREYGIPTAVGNLAAGVLFLC